MKKTVLGFLVASFIAVSIIAFQFFIPDKFRLLSLIINPNNTNNNQSVYDYNQNTRSFGEILGLTDNQSRGFKPDKSNFESSDISKLLAEMQKSSRESREDFQNSRNMNLLANNVTPSPGLDERNLLADLSDFIITPKPTYTPEMERILAEVTAKKFSNEARKLESNGAMEQWSNEESDQSTNLPNPPYSPNQTYIGDIKENPIKTTLVVALLGDSMVETMGEGLPELSTLLKQSYPNHSFALLNWGQGATDLDSGLYRLTHTTRYLGKTYLPLLSYKPDILVVESFAYNPWSANSYDLDRQWLTIAKIIDTVKEKSPTTKIILAATIAPDPLTFGDGSLNWPADTKWLKAQTIKAYLSNLVNFATTQDYPLANAYHPSLNPDGRGNSRFINSSDHLHPSEAGKRLFSEKIVEAIRNNNLLQ